MYIIGILKPGLCFYFLFLQAFYYSIVARNIINLLKAFLVLKQLTLKHKILTGSGTDLDLAAVFQTIYMNCGALWKALRCLCMWLVCLWFTVTSFLSAGNFSETSTSLFILHSLWLNYQWPQFSALLFFKLKKCIWAVSLQSHTLNNMTK